MSGTAHVFPIAQRSSRTRVVVDAPDIVAATDLADRLRAYAPLLSSTGGDGCRLTIPNAGAHDGFRTLLATVREWAGHWELDDVTVGVAGRSYTLASGSKPQPAAEPRPKLLFFYSPRSGHCRRGESLLAQVLQRRRNHNTFDLVRISVDARPDLAAQFGVNEIPAVLVLEGRRVAARLASFCHSHEVESALHPWLR